MDKIAYSRWNHPRVEVAAVIPARGGSVRLPRKNLVPFHGKPMIVHSIDTAKASGLFDAIVVSTDDDEIAELAMGHGCHIVRRPPDDGTAGTQAVVACALAQMPLLQSVRIACCIYATAPLMLPLDLVEGFETLREREAYFVSAVGAEPLRDAGQWYLGYVHHFQTGPLYGRRWVPYVLPEWRVCDINTAEDLQKASEAYLKLQEALGRKEQP